MREEKSSKDKNNKGGRGNYMKPVFFIAGIVIFIIAIVVIVNIVKRK